MVCELPGELPVCPQTLLILFLRCDGTSSTSLNIEMNESFKMSDVSSLSFTLQWMISWEAPEPEGPGFDSRLGHDLSVCVLLQGLCPVSWVNLPVSTALKCDDTRITLKHLVSCSFVSSVLFHSR